MKSIFSFYFKSILIISFQLQRSLRICKQFCMHFLSHLCFVHSPPISPFTFLGLIILVAFGERYAFVCLLVRSFLQPCITSFHLNPNSCKTESLSFFDTFLCIIMSKRALRISCVIEDGIKMRTQIVRKMCRSLHYND
jgi:hypothetical protein